MTFRLTSAASREIRAGALYYESKEPGIGAKFLDEVEAAIARVLVMPQAWRPLSTRTRRCLLRRFPYGIVYQIRGEEILVISVMDLRRNPKSWKGLV